MGEIDPSYGRQRSIRSTVVRMAGTASQAGVVLMQSAMQRGRISPLGGEIHVADNAAVSHGCPVPKCRVTQSAPVADLGV